MSRKMIPNAAIMASNQIAGRVTRWHVWPMIRKPTVAEHACRVAKLYCEIWGLPRAEVLFHCLHHDDGEISAGDTPYHAKRAVPALAAAVNEAERMGLLTQGIVMPELTREELAKFKVCDLLEMYETGVVEFNMGNRYAECVIAGTRRVALEKAAEIEGGWQIVLKWIHEQEQERTDV